MLTCYHRTWQIAPPRENHLLVRHMGFDRALDGFAAGENGKIEPPQHEPFQKKDAETLDDP